ncbi:hypothetical protein ACM1RC_08875 [Paenibacillus azoreducens]|uniref:hypothetical protein n=1 Tax=Paenibacillus azoreducens TaxID=116718 RepID=UPI0039F4E80B
MELKSLQCFLYDNDALNQLIRKTVAFLNENDIRDVIIQKDWVQGFHLNLTWAAAENVMGLENHISSLLSGNDSRYGEQDYERFEVMMETLKKMEGYQGEVLPLMKDGSVLNVTSAEVLKKNPLCGPHINLQVEKLKTEILRRIYLDWTEYSLEQQNMEITKVFFITSQLSPGGIRYGYLSLRSNFEYFKQQLTELKNKDRAAAYYTSIHSRTEAEQEFIQNGVAEFLNEVYDNEPFFNNMRDLIQRLQHVYSEAFEAGELYVKEMHFGDDFLDRHPNASEFHKAFFTNPEFLKQYRSKEFIVYRFIASTIYSLLPLLSISPIRKQKITGMVADSVESHFSTNWLEVYNDMARKLEA